MALSYCHFDMLFGISAFKLSSCRSWFTFFMIRSSFLSTNVLLIRLCSPAITTAKSGNLVYGGTFVNAVIVQCYKKVSH
jgi:hypothetical protein